MRRLPVHNPLDTPGAMFGEPITAVQIGLYMLIEELGADHHALETAHISIITVWDSVEQVVPLTDILSNQSPSHRASGTTFTGEALFLLVECIGKEVREGKTRPKGRIDASQRINGSNITLAGAGRHGRSHATIGIFTEDNFRIFGTSGSLSVAVVVDGTGSEDVSFKISDTGFPFQCGTN